MRNQILARACNGRLGAMAGALDHDDLEAAVLLLPELGFLQASDERFVRFLVVASGSSLMIMLVGSLLALQSSHSRIPFSRIFSHNLITS